MNKVREPSLNNDGSLVFGGVFFGGGVAIGMGAFDVYTGFTLLVNVAGGFLLAFLGGAMVYHTEPKGFGKIMQSSPGSGDDS